MTASFRYLSLGSTDNAEEINMDKKFMFKGGVKECCFLDCGHEKLGLSAIDIPVRHYNDRLASFSFDHKKLETGNFVDPVNYISGGGFIRPVLSEDFLDQIGINKETCPDISYGRLIDPQGSPLLGGRILYSRKPVIVRGSPPPAGYEHLQPRYTVCDKCGYVTYHCAIPDNFFPSPDPEQKIILSTNLGTDIIIRIDSEEERKNIYKIAEGWCDILELDVLDGPRDGIDAILEPYHVTRI